MYKCVALTVVCVLALTANTQQAQAQDSVENLGYKIYTLGVQAARAEGPAKEAMLKQLASLQERQKMLIQQGGPVDSPSVADTAPVARPTGQGPATDWSRGSYGRGQQGCAECGGYMPQQWSRAPQFGTFHHPAPFVQRGSYGYKIGTGIPGLPSRWTGMLRW